MKTWCIPLLAVWLYGCNAGPDEEAVQRLVMARLGADANAQLFDLSDLHILGTESRSEGVYLVRVSYQLHFRQGLVQLQTQQDEDLIYDRVGLFQQEMSLMALEQKYGEFEAGQSLPQEGELWVAKDEQGWHLVAPALK